MKASSMSVISQRGNLNLFSNGVVLGDLLLATVGISPNSYNSVGAKIDPLVIVKTVMSRVCTVELYVIVHSEAFHPSSFTIIHCRRNIIPTW